VETAKNIAGEFAVKFTGKSAPPPLPVLRSASGLYSEGGGAESKGGSVIYANSPIIVFAISTNKCVLISQLKQLWAGWGPGVQALESGCAAPPGRPAPRAGPAPLLVARLGQRGCCAKDGAAVLHCTALPALSALHCTGLPALHYGGPEPRARGRECSPQCGLHTMLGRVQYGGVRPIIPQAGRQRSRDAGRRPALGLMQSPLRPAHCTALHSA
jgi:hypothetical protein